MYMKVSVKYEDQTFQKKRPLPLDCRKPLAYLNLKVNLTLYSPLGLQEVEVL